MLKAIFTLSFLVLVYSQCAYADDSTLKVVPGNYSFTTNTRSNFNPNPRIETEDRCITDNFANMKNFLPDPNACSATNVSKRGNKLSFDIKCTGSQKMPTMTGKAELSATSSTLKSHYKIVGSFQGQDFSINSKSDGLRTGECK